MSSTSLRTVQTIGITTSGLLAGSSLGISFFVVPRLLESPTPLLLKQWRHSFEQGKASMPIGALFSSGTFAFLAWDAYRRTASVLPAQWKQYLASALLAIGIVPYTVLFLRATNEKLLKREEETRSFGPADTIVEVGLGGESAHQLVDRWASLNLGRALMLVVSTALGTWSALS